MALKAYLIQIAHVMSCYSLTASVLFALLCVVCWQHIPHLSKKQIEERIDLTRIKYGATVRIKSIPVPYHLHSHSVNYPRGSGYQSVTGFSADDDYNSLWTIKEQHGSPAKTYSEAIFCDDVIRLEHALTKKNLHSEEIYQSMLTNGQEVSVFGGSGLGNENDNWILHCTAKNSGVEFLGGDVFELVHLTTQMRLRLTKFYEYSFGNWENCPFERQVEVSAVEKSTRETLFKIVGGVFFEEKKAVEDDEL